VSDAIRLRELQRRDYRDPANFLKQLRDLEPKLREEVRDPRVRQLRTNGLREWREARLGALFCHGMTERIGQKIFLSKGEFEDADCVASWTVGDEKHFAPIQIKEVVPAHCNSNSTLDEVIGSLSKYKDADDLTVLIHLNRVGRFNPASVSIPAGLRIAALWVLASSSPNQSKWWLCGDFLETPEGSEFEYPA
jgi:hypothetical protein